MLERYVLMLLAAACFSSLGSCAAPTQIRLNIHTDLPCSDAQAWRGVRIYTGTPDASLESKAASGAAEGCDATGFIGSMVIIPSGEKDAEVGIRVVAGVKRPPEECAAAGYQGCIVARRAVRFDRHGTLELDIRLTADCLSLGCDSTHTCIAGSCTATASVPDALPPPQVIPENQPRVRCGDDGVQCGISGDVCCLTVDRDAGTATGNCQPAASCPRTSIVLNCDDETDCAAQSDDAGVPGDCIIDHTKVSPDAHYTVRDVFSSTCIRHGDLLGGASFGGVGLCNREHLCRDQFACTSSATQRQDDTWPTNPLPGYYWCTISE